MRVLHLFWIGVLVFRPLLAQNQTDRPIAFKQAYDETKKHLLYEYRLPEIGYQQWFVDVNGLFRNNEQSTTSKTNERQSYQLSVLPNYWYYFESEKKIVHLSGNLQLRAQTIEETYSQTTKYQNSIDHKNIRFILNAALQQYFKPKFFFKLQTLQNWYYEENEYENKTPNMERKQQYIQRTLQPEFRIGIGFGRVRNVNPLFRALGFNEIYQSISGEATLNQKELEDLARFFARRTDYFNTFDRPSKYFWADMPSSVEQKLRKLAPWQLMYLTDTWRQIVGTRYEGFVLNGGLAFDYQKKSYTPKTHNFEQALLGLYLDQWFVHNFSLNYQFSVQTFLKFSRTTNHNTPYRNFGTVNLTLNNLFSLLDRLLIELEGQYQIFFRSAEENSQPTSVPTWQRMDFRRLSLVLNYFIENNLAFNLNLNYTHQKSNQDVLNFWYPPLNFVHIPYRTNENLQISFGLRYYFKRDLL